MTDTTAVRRPRIVAWLGYGGLLPFLALVALTYVDCERAMFWHGILRAYAALILSFVGALHWGFAMLLGQLSAPQRNARLAWSVVPCLIAFAALIANSVFGDVLLVSGFLLHYWQDQRLVAMVPLPAWYLPLRLRLSTFAVICVAAGAFA
jgi:hypothetical protein